MPTRQQLALALAADRVIFTSPAAVNAAAQLLPLTPRPDARLVAVGEGTANALRRHGAHDVLAPSRMDSEGLLALPALATMSGLSAGLVTAPGGRGIIAAEVQRRGARLIRANVYARVDIPLPRAGLRRLQALDTPTVLAISSGEALSTVCAHLPAALLRHWQRMPVVAASPRLAQLVTERGFNAVFSASGPMPAQLAAAARDAILTLR